MNIKIKKIVMPDKKTTLQSPRNQDWKTVKTETEKINESFTNTLTNNITELNGPIYAGVKLVCDKIIVP